MLVPIRAGKVVIRNIAIAMAATETSGAGSPMKCTTAQPTANGTVRIENSDTTAVSETQSATSPCACFETILDATPSGQNGKSMTQTAISPVNPKAKTQT